MGITDLIEKMRPYQSISILGMSKNAGKTTVLNEILKETGRERTLGLTSIGRDGEDQDTVTATQKPQIYLLEGTLGATVEQCLGQCDCTLEVLEVTGFATSMGHVVLFRAKSDGFVQLAGPSSTQEMAQVVSKLQAYGADQVLVDGAISRMTHCGPQIAQAAILCSGAALSYSMKETVEKTQQRLETFGLPAYRQDLQRVDPIAQSAKGRSFFLYRDGSYRIVSSKTSLGLENELIEYFKEKTPEVVIIEGVLTQKLYDKILSLQDAQNPLSVMVQDPTKIFLENFRFEKSQRRQVTLYVRHQIPVLCVCINPINPTGNHYPSKEFIENIKAITKLPVLNVLGGEVI